MARHMPLVAVTRYLLRYRTPEMQLTQMRRASALFVLAQPFNVTVADHLVTCRGKA